MSCACRKTAKVSGEEVPHASIAAPEAENKSYDLPQCYECTKKHLARAQIFFEEYHTGYPDHIKNLMCSMRVAEAEVRKAFLIWNKTQAHLDMAANELLGREVNGKRLSQDHLALACDIRNQRVELANNPLFIPKFDDLLIAVQKLEYSSL